MPVTESILESDWLGPILKQGEAQGRLAILRRQAEKRFGPLPAWADQHLSTLTAPELDDLALRLLDARSLDDLFGR